MAEVFKTPAEKSLEDRYSPEASLNQQADNVLADLGFADEETGIILPEPQPPEDQGLLSKAGDVAGDIASGAADIATDPKKIANVVAGSVVDTTEELGNFAIDSANFVDDWMQERGFTSQDFIKEDFRLDYADRLVPQSEDGGTRIARKIGGYLIPFTGSFKALKAAKGLNTLGRTFAAGAATGFAAIDPDEKNLSNLVQEESDLLAPLASFMAISEDDSKLEARFKNAMESVVLDTALLGGGKALVAGVKSSGSMSRAAFKHFQAVKKARALTKRSEKIAEAAKVVEAEGEGVLRVSTKDIIPGSDVNLLTISNDKDILKIIKDSAKKDLPGIQKARGGKKTAESLKAEAKLIEDAPEKIKALLQNGEERILNASETIAANNLLEKSIIEIKPIVDKALASGKSVDQVAASEAFETVQRLQRVVFGNKAEQGRALAAHRISAEAKAAAAKSEYVANVIELRGGKISSAEDLVAISQALDVPASQLVKVGGELIEKSLGRKVFDAAFEVRVNGLVSGPKTVGIAVANGVFRAPLEIAERGLAAIFTRNKPLGEKVFFSEAVEQTRALFDESTSQFYALMGGLFDGTKIASHPKIVKSLESQKNLPAFLDVLSANNINKTINAKNFGLEGFAGEATDAIGSVISAPTSLLQRTDRSIGAVHYRMEARALAAREAGVRGLRGKDAVELIEQLSSAPPSSLRPQFKELANQIKDQAVAQANKARFLSPLEGALKTAEDTFRHAPGLRIFVPFARIDLNILSQSMERIPGLARFAPEYKNAIAQGGPAAAQAKARVALGGTFMMGIGAMTLAGQVTGDGPKDSAQRKLLEAQGWQPNSIRVGDTYVRYDRFAEPIARAMKLAANMADVAGFVYGEMKDENVSANAKDLMAATAGVIAATASPEFLTGGLGDLIRFVESPERGVDPVLRQVVAGQVPFSALLRTVRQEIDPAKRTTKSLDETALGVLEQQWNEVKNLIPGFSDTLPPQRNMFGEVVHYPPGLGPDMISPIYATEFEKDSVIEELVRLGSAGPLMHPKAKPGEEHLVVRMPANTISNSAAGVSQPIKMSPEQYDKFIQLAAGIGLEGVDMTLKEKLKEIIDSDYADFDGLEKTDQLKRTVIAKWVDTYRSIAQAQLVSEEQDIQTQMRENFDNISRAFGGEGL